jgi:hypothetical protein
MLQNEELLQYIKIIYCQYLKKSELLFTFTDATNRMKCPGLYRILIKDGW